MPMMLLCLKVRLDRDTDPAKVCRFRTYPGNSLLMYTYALKAGWSSWQGGFFRDAKMSRILSELARSKSIASNFDTKCAH